MGTGQSKELVIDERGTKAHFEVSDDAVRRILGQASVNTGSPVRDGSTAGQGFSSTRVNEMSLKQIEERNAQMLKMNKEEFARAVQEVEKKFMRTSCSPVCQDLQQKVFDCYHSNPHETLNCSKEVRAFSNCVESARQNALTRRSL